MSTCGGFGTAFIYSLTHFFAGIACGSWALDYVPGADLRMDGQIVLKMSGGHFPYYVRYTYPERASPDILVTCEPPPP